MKQAPYKPLLIALTVSLLVCIYYLGLFHWATVAMFFPIAGLIAYRTVSDVALLVGIALLIAGVIVGVEGGKISSGDGFSMTKLIGDFYANVATEAIGIAITVIVIDTLNRRRESKQDLKATLTYDLRSRSPDVVRRTLTELRKRGWLDDGTLRRAYLSGADLSGADLSFADLSDAYLSGTNLEGTVFRSARLLNADLSQSNLQGANFSKAMLRSANLDDCNLIGTDFTEADLTSARIDQESVGQVRSYAKATMPNGVKFENWALERDGEGE